LFVERHHQLRKDLIVNHTLSQFLIHVGKSAEGKGGTLRDGGHIVEEKWTQETHHSGGLEGLDVLGTRGQFGDGLDEGDSCLLVLFERLKNCLAHE
jgi:hypothetical protein